MKNSTVIALALVVAGIVVPYIWAGWDEQPLDDDARRQAPGKFVSLSDGQVHYLWQGPADGEVIVLVHGVSVPHYVFAQAADALAVSGYRILLFDLFGHGFSDRPDARYDADFFDRQLVELFDELGLQQPFHLAALSMGGIIVAEFTARHPERVKTLSLFAPAGLRLVNETDSNFVKLLKAPVIGNWLWRILAHTMYFSSDDDPPSEVEIASGEKLHGVAKDQADYQGYLMAMRQIFRFLPLSHRDEVFSAINKTDIPVLGIFGDADDTIHLDSAELLGKLIPRAQVEVIDGATHHLNIHRWRDVDLILQGFLADKPTSAVSGQIASPQSDHQ